MSVEVSPRPAVAIARPAARAPEVLGWLTLAALLLVAVPLYLAMPLTIDVFFYDACGQVVLRGGALEKEILFLPPPGMAWALAGERALLGGSRLAVRIADILIVATVVGLLCRWLRTSGLSRAACVWTAVALFAFYLGTSEWIHAQPDIWMMLPAVAALWLRRGAVEAAVVGDRRSVVWSVGEGVLWGTACLFKPQVVLAGLLTWLVSAVMARRSGTGGLRRLIPDALGLLAGGLLVGALWLGSMAAHGAWYDYWHNVAEFRGYYSRLAPPWADRLRLPVTRFPVWGWLHLPALLIALVAIAQGAGVSGRPAAALMARDRLAALLGACYLGWLAEADLVQSGFSYHLVPAVMLALVVVAGWVNRWPRPVLPWAAFLGFAALAAGWGPAFQPARLALWGRCWEVEPSAEMKDRLGMYSEKPSWRNLARAAAFLRAQGVTDRDLLCYDSTTVPLYHDLHLRPASRCFFPVLFEQILPSRRAVLVEEMRAGPQRYIITNAWEAGSGPAAEPWPYCEPVVFKTGRYRVHRVSSGGTEAGAAR